MEALKLAFDTLIVGALALPWLMVLLRMYLAPGTGGKAEAHWAILSVLPEHARETVVSVVILALGYFLGSAVSRISDDLFGDDEVWPLATEPSIREDVYYHEYCDVHSVLAAKGLPKELFGPDLVSVAFCAQKNWSGRQPRRTARMSDVVIEFFRLQEGKLLLQGEDKTARLRELRSQIVILRGATLNGMVLSILCLFGFCVSFWRRPWSWRNLALTHAAAVALAVYGGYCFWHHFDRLGSYHAHRDPPLAEGLIILLGIAGLLPPARVENRWRYARGCGLSFALSLMAYGAWWSTEVMYNQNVIHAYHMMQ